MSKDYIVYQGKAYTYGTNKNGYYLYSRDKRKLSEGFELDADPASGNGFIKSDEYTVPEYVANNPNNPRGNLDLEPGSKMYLNIDGEEVLIGKVNADGMFEYVEG